MKNKVLACIVLLVLLVPSIGAVEFISEDQVTIDTQIDDDLFVSGNTVTINAQVNGDVFAAGGTIEINAPIKGDLIVAGGEITINDNVEGKILAGGGVIILKGHAEKVVAVGGTVMFHSTVVIDKYALTAGGMVNNAGTIAEELYVGAGTFENTGTAGEIIRLEEPEVPEEVERGISFFSFLLSLAWKVGFFILGIIFIKWFGAVFYAIQDEVKESWLKKLVIGFLAMLLTGVILFILAITVVGLPIAVVLALFFIIAVMMAGIIVSYSFGEWLLKLAKVEPHWAITFLLGFVLVNLFFMIPYVGILIRIIVVSLGFGAIFYTVKNHWGTITAPRA